MGTEYKVQCNDCDYQYNVRIGGGIDFYLLHCAVCGKEKRVSIESMTQSALSGEFAGEVDTRASKLAGSCDVCGGVFKLDALPRCPKCRATEYTEQVIDGNVVRHHYD